MVGWKIMTTNKNNVLKRDIEAVLHLYGFDTVFSEPKEYINHYDEQEGSVK